MVRISFVGMHGYDDFPVQEPVLLLDGAKSLPDKDVTLLFRIGEAKLDVRTILVRANASFSTELLL
jgi:hypothetical protein